MRIIKKEIKASDSDVVKLYDYLIDMVEVFDENANTETVYPQIKGMLKHQNFEPLLNLCSEDNLFEVESILVFYGYKPSWLDEEIDYTREEFDNNLIPSSKLKKFLEDKIIILEVSSRYWEIAHDFDELTEILFKLYPTFTYILIYGGLDTLDVNTKNDTITVKYAVGEKNE